ncbi:hypothetical protein NQ318_003555 [Aromia moschata]|uniref:Uncharacterized protein n=1 Tax=Aromia moschata TaxID=1265417 RepID=A0AAV8YXH0_9CUCU|nr:hypothetical protein NQ318_003555 [Aromia moschata]
MLAMNERDGDSGNVEGRRESVVKLLTIPSLKSSMHGKYPDLIVNFTILDMLNPNFIFLKSKSGRSISISHFGQLVTLTFNLAKKQLHNCDL